jgi:hypothetical protein
VLTITQKSMFDRGTQFALTEPSAYLGSFTVQIMQFLQGQDCIIVFRCSDAPLKSSTGAHKHMPTDAHKHMQPRSTASTKLTQPIQALGKTAQCCPQCWVPQLNHSMLPGDAPSAEPLCLLPEAHTHCKQLHHSLHQSQGPTTI